MAIIRTRQVWRLIIRRVFWRDFIGTREGSRIVSTSRAVRVYNLLTWKLRVSSGDEVIEKSLSFRHKNTERYRFVESEGDLLALVPTAGKNKRFVASTMYRWIPLLAVCN